MSRCAVREIDMTNMNRKIGIVDPGTGKIIFVSREEGEKHLKKSAQPTAVQMPVDAIKIKLSGNKGPGI